MCKLHACSRAAATTHTFVRHFQVHNPHEQHRTSVYRVGVDETHFSANGGALFCFGRRTCSTFTTSLMRLLIFHGTESPRLMWGLQSEPLHLVALRALILRVLFLAV